MSVKLRALTYDDIPAIIRLLNTGPEISVRTARIPFPYTEEDARKFVTSVAEGRERAYAIVSSTSGELIGAIGMAGAGPEPEAGYWIGTQYWGQGYATAALARLIEIAREDGVTKLTAWVFPDNPASGRVLEKNGFQYVGRRERNLPLRGGMRTLCYYELTVA